MKQHIPFAKINTFLCIYCAQLQMVMALREIDRAQFKMNIRHLKSIKQFYRT